MDHQTLKRMEAWIFHESMDLLGDNRVDGFMDWRTYHRMDGSKDLKFDHRISSRSLNEGLQGLIDSSQVEEDNFQIYPVQRAFCKHTDHKRQEWNPIRWKMALPPAM